MEIGEKVKKLIVDYLSGKATREDIVNLTEWIQASPDNLSYYRKIHAIWQGLTPAFAPEDIDVDRAHAQFMKKLHRRSRFVTALSYWPRVAVAVAIPLLLIAIYLFANKPHGDLVEAYQEVFSPYGTYSKVNLPDGSIAWLNAGSSLKYPLAFTAGERAVSLSGEAYFEVQSDRDNPFSVQVKNVTIKATGTAFNVEAYKNDSLIAVTLTRGKVGIQIGRMEAFDLSPGERMGYNTHTNHCEMKKTDTYKWYAWKDGKMVFRDDPLGYVFKRIGQTFNVDIVVRDSDIAGHLYRATFEKESLDEILKLLKLSAPIQYLTHEREKSGDEHYIKQHIEVVRVGKKRK
jgi:ferric-dicitrate binding protein FerR (iron transport regulator)